MDVKETILDIKKELRANMNGIASAAMRQSADYRVNFGVELPRIHDIANEFEANHELAQALWKENVRECRILATILMPTDKFDEEICDIWVEDIKTIEIAQLFCMNLVNRLKYASVKAFEWMASDKEMVQCCGYLTLCHVLRRGELQDRSADEFLDQASSVLSHLNNESGEVVKPTVLDSQVFKALQIFASQSEVNAEKVKKIADYLS
jgi:3-methyladenine DNA glycosylase AlkD